MMLLSHISEVYMYEYPRVLVRDRGCAKELLKFYQVSFADRKYVLPDAFDQYLQGACARTRP